MASSLLRKRRLQQSGISCNPVLKLMSEPSSASQGITVSSFPISAVSPPHFQTSLKPPSQIRLSGAKNARKLLTRSKTVSVTILSSVLHVMTGSSCCRLTPLVVASELSWPRQTTMAQNILSHTTAGSFSLVKAAILPPNRKD